METEKSSIGPRTGQSNNTLFPYSNIIEGTKLESYINSLSISLESEFRNLANNIPFEPGFLQSINLNKINKSENKNDALSLLLWLYGSKDLSIANTAVNNIAFSSEAIGKNTIANAYDNPFDKSFNNKASADRSAKRAAKANASKANAKSLNSVERKQPETIVNSYLKERLSIASAFMLVSCGLLNGGSKVLDLLSLTQKLSLLFSFAGLNFPRLSSSLILASASGHINSSSLTKSEKYFAYEAFSEELARLFLAMHIENNLESYANSISHESYLNDIALSKASLLRIAARFAIIFSNSKKKHKQAIISFSEKLAMAFEIANEIHFIAYPETHSAPVTGYAFFYSLGRAKQSEKKRILSVVSLNESRFIKEISKFSLNGRKKAKLQLQKLLNNAKSKLSLFEASEAKQKLMLFTDALSSNKLL